ncbi:MAG TPA: OmpA family protein, partial [Symbiobacteriaceae bacterium]|nr:OmpA family protein [Symbiobacteriaceae bacterium]
PGRDPNSTPGAPAPAEPDVTMPAPPLPSVVLPDEPVAEPGSVAEPEPEPEPEPTPAPASKPVEPPPKPVDPFASMANGFKAALAARAGQVDVVLQDRGVVVSVLTSVLFEPGQAELKPGAGQILDEIASQLAGGTESIVVEGAPDASDTQAPWDLASRRASAVVGYLVDTQGHSPARFSVIGYGKGAGVDGIVNVVVLRRR